MRHSAYLNIFLGSVFFIIAASTALGADLPAGYKEYKRNLATAALFSNVRKTDDSVAKVSEQMVKDAFADGQSYPGNIIALSVVPNKYLSGSSDADHCTQLSAEFQKTPVVFGPRDFDSVSAFSEWLSELAQGKGDDGKVLYEKCDATCSPSYAVKIKRDRSKYNAVATTFCNQPRDKSDNLYAITSGFPN